VANNIEVISGTTGGTCGSNTAGLIGGTTAANGLNNAANSGQAIGNGGFAVAQVATNNDDICLITSAATPLAGVIKYVVKGGLGAEKTSQRGAIRLCSGIWLSFANYASIRP